jgi:hypothetical protein
MAQTDAKTSHMNLKMKKFIFPIIGMALMTGCSSMKKTGTVSNFDDAYFVPADIDKSEVYGQLNPNMFQPRATADAGNMRSTRSYSQSYNDRLRNFGGSSFAPSYRPALMVSPFGTSMGFSPYGYNPYAYNPYMYGMNPYGGYGYDPYGMGYGYNPYGYNNYYNPGWCYWNQYYSPYNYNYWGSGSVGGNRGSGSTWGGNKNASSSGYVGSGQRRRSYNSTIPSSSQGSRTGTTWSSSSSQGGDNYYRPSSGNTSSGSSGATYTRPNSSGPTQSTGGGQSGSSGHRR